MLRRRPPRATSLLPLLLAAPLAAAPVEVVVRDAATGARLAAVVRVDDGPRPTCLTADGQGRVEADLPPGDHLLEVAHPGHRSLSFRLHVAAGGSLPTTVWLDPEALPAALEPRLLATSIPAGHGLLHGFVRDAATGAPLAGAVVSLEQRGAGDVADSEGRFRVLYRLEPVGAEELPPADTLLVEADGHRALAREGTLLGPGATLLLLDLERGEGLVAVPARHKMLNLAEPSQVEPPEWMPEDARAPGGLRAITPLDPPASIRLGTPCSCTTCTGMVVLSLETYVKRGLNDEWISSWGGNSLRAGAVAYRSYGAWYVAHPLSASYDICDNTCCQVNDGDTASSTDAATEATAGFMLERSGAVFRSEYSAENNAWDDPGDGLPCSNGDLSCADGEAGSPAASWPCLADSICAGHGCFGHGRGMCQWGTSRWSAAGSAWTWMVDHYYNDHGAGSSYRTAYLTTPLWVDGVEPQPATVEPATTLTIAVAATNGAELAHGHVLVGASLYSPATGYLSDPPHDALVTLDPGANARSRLFDVPAGTPDGSYDLLVSLYYDVNLDGTITSADKNLVLVTADDAVTVSSLPTLTVADLAVAEGDRGSAAATLTLTLSAPAPAGGASVAWATGDGTASAGADYLAGGGSAQFAAGATAATVGVTVLGDYLVEGDEAFAVALSDPVGARFGDPTATVTILDDDGPPCDAVADGVGSADDVAETLRAVFDPAHLPAGNPDCDQDGDVDPDDVAAVAVAAF